MRQALLFLLFTWSLFAGLNDEMLQRLRQEPEAERFSFAVLGDNRDGDMVFERILKRLEKEKVAFAVNNGDLVSNGLWYQYERYIEQVKSTSLILISTIGNHDIPFYSDCSNFKKYIGEPYFSWSYAQSYFIALNNAAGRSVIGKQLAWLKEELKRSRRFKYRFVFLHVPLFDPRRGYMQSGHSMHDSANARMLLELFEKYGVSLVVASHIHTLLQGYWGDVPFLITGGAGAPNSRDGGFFHYVVIDVTPKGFRPRVVRLTP